MRILKFGGTSIGNTENIKKMLNIVSASRKKGRNLVIIVSAFGGVTNDLLEVARIAASGKEFKQKFARIKHLHHNITGALMRGQRRGKTLRHIDIQLRELGEILQGVAFVGDLSLRSLDAIMGMGERLSSYIIGEALSESNVPCTHFDSRRLVKTDSNFGEAHVNEKETYRLIADALQNKKGVCIAGGFIASNEDGVPTTLGRSGSDYSASIFGAALRAEEIEIWTDVNGVMTADPRKVDNAFPLKHISYIEASELAHFGANVIHPKTMFPARKKNIPIHIKNTFNPELPGTVISRQSSYSERYVKSVSLVGDISLIRVQSGNTYNISDIAARIFEALGNNGIHAILTSQASAEPSMCVAIKESDTKRAEQCVHETFALEIKTGHVKKVRIEKGLAIVAIIGQQMKGVPGISGKMFNALGQHNINIVAIAQGSSELNISAVISRKDGDKALNVLHSEFFANSNTVVHIFLVGTGLIGTTLLDQINKIQSVLPQKHGVDLRICGIANVQKMVFNETGIDVASWVKKLSRSSKSDISAFIANMKQSHLPNKIFVDCTASEQVAKEYLNILSAGVSIVTPNKKAMSGKMRNYEKLKHVAKDKNVRFLYETNVGAALPVISTLQDLSLNGDTVVKIEAILSGTLSYIFNTFGSSSKTFSSIVKDAKQKGFTEPDPRDDLNGMDVARKILILAREAGADLEIKDIKLQQILPKKCLTAKTITAFFKELKNTDEQFSKRREKLSRMGKVQRHIAKFEHGRATVSIKEVDSTHPFFNMSGSDNIVSITTKRYCNTPIIIKGAGAGAKVTAGGVLADIIRVVL